MRMPMVLLLLAFWIFLAYRALQLWIPAALGSVAFVQLRHSLAREPKQAALRPLAEIAPV